ncbi:MAG: sulfurtransferase TusA family protein [Chloroflexi bacterium]|nr:sulfurtransferase TusA family protein [Chloroflexota bacterium]
MRVDVRGEICPYPMLKAVEAMKKAKPSEVIEVLTDHAPALETIPTQASRLGFSVKIGETKGGEWRITLSRASPS